MNVSKKDWFCYQCSLQFNSSQVYDLHLKLLHKQIETQSIKNEPKSNEVLANDTKSDICNQIVSLQTEMKTFKCEICEYRSPQKSHLKRHMLSNHSVQKMNKCAICSGNFETKPKLQEHIESAHGKKVPLDSL